MDNSRYTKNKTKKSKTNFYYSFLFLPKAKREAIFTIYSFCRQTDDIVDTAKSPDEARKELEAWRRELDASFDDHPTHPITQALQEVVRRFKIPREYFHELIDGCEMDLVKKRYDTFDELRQYCYRVASAVGLICIEIFGYRNPNTKDYAINLGLALQLTNIMRDVGEDACNGRIYLPAEDLDRFHYSEADLMNADYSPQFIDLMRFHSERTQSFYDAANSLYDRRDHHLLFPAEIMKKIYYLLFQKIQRQRYNVYQNRIRVPNSRKMTIALSTFLGSKIARVLP
ncbi:MAG: presqualene diphosphate synthase HpnD [Candidatus Omnitrophica bacterium]|nr:presqualene diphosphate synthase HpnD [Candidatus Omnitrophota bacterium]